MDQIQTALTHMGTVLESRDSVFTATDERVALDHVGMLTRIKQSILSTFEERCSRTGVLKATWIFNRNSGKFILNQIRRNEHHTYKVSLL